MLITPKSEDIYLPSKHNKIAIITLYKNAVEFVLNFRKPAVRGINIIGTQKLNTIKIAFNILSTKNAHIAHNKLMEKVAIIAIFISCLSVMLLFIFFAISCAIIALALMNNPAASYGVSD